MAFDFSSVDLSFIDLSFIDLSFIDLSFIDLSFIDLSFIDLSFIGRHAEIAIAAIVVATWLSAWLVLVVLRRYQGRLFPAALKSASLVATLARVAIWAIGGMLVLDQLGVSIAPLLAALGVGGLAVALALQPTLGNLFSGLHLLMSRQINPGDYVSFVGGEGRIVDITWRNTIIADHIGATIVVPNQQLAQATVTSFTTDEGIAYPIAFSVPRALDLDGIEEQLAATATAAGARAASLRLLTMSGGAVQCVLRIAVPRNGDPFAIRDAVVRAVFRLIAAHD